MTQEYNRVHILTSNSTSILVETPAYVLAASLQLCQTKVLFNNYTHDKMTQE